MAVKREAAVATVGVLAADALASWLLLSDKANPVPQLLLTTLGLACMVFGAGMHHERTRQATVAERESGVVVTPSSFASNDFAKGHAAFGGLMALMTLAMLAAMQKTQYESETSVSYGWQDYRWMAAGASIAVVHALTALAGVALTRSAQRASHTQAASAEVTVGQPRPDLERGLLGAEFRADVTQPRF